MEYRKLGNTNIKVSCIGLGTWPFSNDEWWGHQDDDKSKDVVRKALDLGISLMDTAPAYGRGHVESLLGEVLKGRRKDIILATKVGLSWTKSGEVYNDSAPKRIEEEVEESLSRLQTDYIDLYQVHWPDPETPIKETASKIAQILKKGIIRAVGVSNYSLSQMQEFMKYCPLHTIQPPYNMFRREIEKDILPFCKSHNISVLTYGTLHYGILTGKFFKGKEIPHDKIRELHHADLSGVRFDINKETILELEKIAKKKNCSLTQLVIRWTMIQPGITSCLCGARNISQIEENAKSLKVELRDEGLEEIKNILSKRQSRLKDIS